MAPKRLIIAGAHRTYQFAVRAYGYSLRDCRHVARPDDLNGYKRETPVLVYFGGGSGTEMWDAISHAKALGMPVSHL